MINLSKHLKLAKIKDAAEKIFTPTQEKNMTCVLCKEGIDDIDEPLTGYNMFGAMVKVCHGCQVQGAGELDTMLKEIEVSVY